MGLIHLNLLFLILQVLLGDTLGFTAHDAILEKLLLDKHTTNFRLPKYAEPLDYFVKIYPIKNEDETFRGFVQMHLMVLQETRILALNMAEMDIDYDSVKIIEFDNSEQKIIEVVDYRFYPMKEIITFMLGTTLQKNKLVQFSCFFSGSIVSESYGLNRYSYDDDSGVKNHVLVTYFQPIGARRVFPCLDEPRYKARFILHIASHKESSVMSNMQINRTVPILGSDFVWNQFKKSLPMSTYLVAFLISNFTTHSTAVSQITRVWSRESILRNTSYAASIAPKALKFYEKYFGVRYPLKKLDLVTLPSYPVPGMENFGLIITKEDSLTTKNEFSRKEWVATVTAHEIAHQWAGNLVTPQSWSQSWLSEGFASYFAAKSLDKVEPQLEATNHMMVEHVRIVMIGDEELDWGQTLEIKHFDPLVQDTKNIHIYYKGAAVLRMLNSVLGEDIFAEGIKTYFRKYIFQSVTERDFYDIFTTGNFSFVKDNLPTSIENIMKGWTTQESYPLLTVNRLDNGTISITQDIFTEKKNESRNEVLNDVRVSSTWWIPISYYTSKDANFSTTPKAWYPPTHEPLLLNEDVLPGSWIVLNSQQSCYLRVNYDNDLWDSISQQLILDHSKIHLLNRAQLFMDAFHLFEKGHIDIDKALGLMRYLGKERSYIPFYTAMRPFSQIEIKMRGNSHYGLLKSFLSSIIVPVIEGKFGKTYTEQKRFQIATSWACQIQNKKCTKFAKILFRLWEVTNDLSIYSELAKKSLLCSAVESGSEEEWGVVFRRAFDTETPNEVTEILREALSCSDNKTRIESLLNFIVEGSHTLSYNDVMDMYNYLVRSMRWNELTWNHINEQFYKLKTRYDFTPIPFVVTPRDLEKFLTIVKKFDPSKKDLFQPYIDENIKFAEEGGRTISQVTQWLVKMAPFEAPK
ncbi:UNVERIFIED_CONTAM: hypothetical protein RMT77_008189 [Armadillidium vulgare]